ncbi:hypothetical protein G6F59_009639 [Rhizopus arrhizus]|nr:hypothetical protein G6F59_009639 [Rhizopus arrhizus]
MVRSLPLDVQDNIEFFLKSGHSYSYIIKRVPGVKKSTISDYKRRWFPNMGPLKSDRRSEITATTKSYIRRSVIARKLKTGKDVQRYLCDLGCAIGYSACLKLLKSMGFQARIKKHKPFLKAIHMKKRLAWANAHKDWTKDDWRRMVFSDETKVNVWGSDGVKYYWKRVDDKLRFHHLDLTVKGGGGSVMMWGCITYDVPGYACRIYDGTMKKEDYVHILDITLMDTLNYYNYDPKNIYFQQDNDPKHTSKVAKAWFEENNFDSKSIYSWPAQSPDLNPIEHVWHHLKLKLSAYETRAKGVYKLWDQIEEQWARFTKDDCRKYIDSMPDRIKAVIQAKGGYTDY